MFQNFQDLECDTNDIMNNSGDILLMNGGTAKSRRLVWLQKPFYPKVTASHIAIHIGANNFVHATGGRGVHCASIVDVLHGANDGWRVIRMKNLTEEKLREIFEAANYFMGQSYNKRFMMNERREASFCSELAVKIYARAGIRLFPKKRPSRSFPAHFEMEANSLTDWEDVTNDYRLAIEAIRNDPRSMAGLEAFGGGILNNWNRTSSKNMEAMFRIALQLLPESDEVRALYAEMQAAKKFKYWDLPESLPGSTELPHPP